MRKLNLIFGVLFLQLFWFTSLGRGQTPTTKPVDRYGVVLAPDNKPFPGAQVTLVEYKTETRGYVTSATATSDAQGKFQFIGVAPNTAMAVVRATGFGLAGVILQETSAESPVEINLKPPTELKLKFTGPDGNPVAGMKVWPTSLRDQTTNMYGYTSYVMVSEALKDELTRTTDASGVCTFPGMPQGWMFMYEIGDDRFASLNNSASIKLAAAPTTDGGTIQLELGGLISGRVTAADSGKPIAQMNVMAQGQGPDVSGQRIGWLVNGQTDADGKFVIKRVRSGSYDMRFELSPELAAQYAGPAMDSFTMAAGQEVTDKNIALVTGGIIKGKVTKVGSGEPIAKVMIYAYSIDNNQGRMISQSNAITKEDGTYSFHVTPGQQQVNLNDVPAGYLMPRSTTKQLTVVDGQTVAADFELAVNPNPELKGHVVDDKGAPVAGASIVLENVADRQNNSPRSSQAQTDKDGAFTIPGVADSTAVRAHKGTMSTVAALFVTSQNRQDMKVVVQKDAAATARIKLVDNAGKPIPDGEIILIQRAGNSSYGMSSGTSGADGIQLIPSLYPDSSYSVQARAKGYGTVTANLTLKPGATTDVPVTLVKADSFVAGMVLDENQLPLADTEVYASGSKSSQQTAKTDFTGHFRINNIVPGDTLTVYTRAGNRIAQQPPDRVPAGTENMILIHNPAAAAAPATRPAPAARRGP